MERTIRVTGKGKLSVKPDMMRLRINIEGMYEEYDETLRKSSDCVEILKDLIEKLGYERKELKTLYFNIDTEYESYQARDKSWKRRFKGYMQFIIQFYCDLFHVLISFRYIFSVHQ